MRPIPRTTDEDALLAAIVAAPLDDAPRLVYADWLQDRGQDAKAEYVRTVVSLLHPPEDPVLLERCIALAEELDADWRQAVGGRFEVVLEGALGVELAAFVLRMAMSFALQEHIRPWFTGEPVRLQRSLTREDAEELLLRPFFRQTAPYDPSIKLFVRPMDAEG